jgi:hypothetical protein
MLIRILAWTLFLVCLLIGIGFLGMAFKHYYVMQATGYVTNFATALVAGVGWLLAAFILASLIDQHLKD